MYSPPPAMSFFRIFSGASACALVACSSPPRLAETAGSRDAAPVVTPQELTMVQGHVRLGALTLEQNGKAGLELLPDGLVKVPGEGRVLGRLNGDGRFVNPRGELLAQLTEEGEVALKDDEFLPVTIGKDGDLKLLKEGRTIRLHDDGSVEGTSPNMVITVRGVTPETRRTALFLLVLASYPLRSRP